jgi:amicoumacin kinase
VSEAAPPAAVIPERFAATLPMFWGGDAATLEPLRQGESQVYRFRAAGGGGERRILRLTSDAHRVRSQLEAELEFVTFVRTRGVSAAPPLRSGAGEEVVTVALAAGGVVHAVAFEEMPGRHFAYRSPDIDRPLFARWGRAMGTLHAASRAFRPAAGRPRRHRWSEDEVLRCGAGALPPSEDAARREHERLHGWLATLPETPESFGLIHGDFERTNFLLDGDERLHVFDFDDACYHWYLADAAHALWAFRGAAPDERRRFLGWFLDGYREGGGVDSAAFDDVAETVGRFVRLRSLALFVHHLRRGSASEAWAERMRAWLAAAERFRW